MKNTKTIVCAVISLVVVLFGASLWTRTSQDMRGNTEAVPRPTLDIRAVTWDSKANTLVVAGKFPQAVEAFQKSLEIQDNPVIRYELAKALAKSGRKQDAIESFKQVAQGPNPIMAKKAKRRISQLESGAAIE